MIALSSIFAAMIGAHHLGFSFEIDSKENLPMEMQHSSRQISENGGIHLFNGAVLAALTWRLTSMTALSSFSAAVIAALDFLHCLQERLFIEPLVTGWLYPSQDLLVPILAVRQKLRTGLLRRSRPLHQAIRPGAQPSIGRHSNIQAAQRNCFVSTIRRFAREVVFGPASSSPNA